MNDKKTRNEFMKEVYRRGIRRLLDNKKGANLSESQCRVIGFVGVVVAIAQTEGVITSEQAKKFAFMARDAAEIVED